MTEPSDLHAALEPEPADQDLARRLLADRPVPAADFRGELARMLRSEDPGYGPRPKRLWTIVALYLASGVVLTALGALQATGVL